MLLNLHWKTLLSSHPINNKPFFVQDYGELEGSTSYWVADEETSQKGFVQKFEDISGFKMKPRMPGLPGTSKVNAD